MLTAAVLVGILAFVNAHDGNMMGGNMGNMGHYGMMNGMSQQMGGNMVYQMGGNMGGQMGGNGQQMSGGMGGGQQGIMGGVMLLLLQNLMQNRGGQGNTGNQMHEEEMHDVEDQMNQKMMMEMVEMMMMQSDFKEKQNEFSQAMEATCFMMAADYEYYKRTGTEVWLETDDAMMQSLGMQIENMNEREKQDFAINMMNNEPRKYAEVFLRFITWACQSGEAYDKAYMKMEKMDRGESECETK